MKTIEKELEQTEILWNKAIQSGNKKLMSLYCNKSSELKKQIFPVELTILTKRDAFGNNTNEKYLEVNFSKANNGWYDSKIFHKVVNGRIVTNEIGIELDVKFSKSGGSAFLEFKVESLNEVKKQLELNGYKTEIK